MPHSKEQRRKQAIDRYLRGDRVEDICRALSCSKSWLYKWRNRYLVDDPNWAKDRTRRPLTNPTKTSASIDKTVVCLLNQRIQDGKPGTGQAIQQILEQKDTEPMPSLRTIHRILHRHKRAPPE